MEVVHNGKIWIRAIIKNNASKKNEIGQFKRLNDP